MICIKGSALAIFTIIYMTRSHPHSLLAQPRIIDPLKRNSSLTRDMGFPFTFIAVMQPEKGT